MTTPRTRLLAAFTPDARPDADLLAAGDGEAFAELVRRYGPLVRGVCRRTVGDAHLAEDAAQATFLVLLRKAGRVRSDAVAGFLFTTARFTALRARTAARRRHRRETPMHPLPEPAVEPTAVDGDALAALVEEMSRLPARLRAAVLVCELDGTPRAVAAARLGIPEGTLSSRLSAARKTLADRLRRRGVTAPLAALAVAGPPTATATPYAHDLAEEVLRAMTVAAIKPFAAAAVLIAVTGLVALSRPPADAPAAKAGPPPLNRLLVAKHMELSLLDPTGATAPNSLGQMFFFATLSPAGDRLAADEWIPGAVHETDKNPWPPLRAVVRRLDGTGPTTVIPKLDPAAAENSYALRWSADGSRLLVRQVRSPRGPDGHAEKVGHWEYDPTAGTATEIRLPDGHDALDWTADRQRLLVSAVTTTAQGGRQFRMAIFDRRTGKAEPIGPPDRTAHPIRFAPDGGRMLYAGNDPDQSMRLRILDLATKADTPLTDPADFWSPLITGAWSPDGRRVAFARKKRFGGTGDDAAANVQVVTCDTDGSNRKVVAAFTLMGEPAVHTNGYTVFDWR